MTPADYARAEALAIALTDTMVAHRCSPDEQAVALATLLGVVCGTHRLDIEDAVDDVRTAHARVPPIPIGVG